MTTMQVSVLRKAGDIGVEEREVPTPGRGEVLVEIGSVGVCGSDVHYYEHGRIGPYVVDSPLVLGHEAGGMVGAGGGGGTHLPPGHRGPPAPGPAGLHRAGDPVPLLPGVPRRALQPLPRRPVLRDSPLRRRLLPV